MLAASAANQTPPPPPVYDEEGQLVEQPKVSRSAQTPGMLAQFFALFFRRCKNFVRDGGQLTLQIAIMIGFPILVILFDLDGVDQLERLRETLPQTPADFKQDTEVITKNLNLAGLVSGLVMFQVVLLTLMGSNNSAREIAGERPIFEKEKLGGVRPLVYIVSKVAFLSIFVFIQSLWMAAFVDVICEIPAPFMAQFSFLFLVNAAMTAICLGYLSPGSNGRSGVVAEYLSRRISAAAFRCRFGIAGVGWLDHTSILFPHTGVGREWSTRWMPIIWNTLKTSPIHHLFPVGFVRWFCWHTLCLD